MPIDPTAFARIGAPDLTPRSTLGMIGAHQQGVKTRLAEEESRLSGLAMSAKATEAGNEDIKRKLLQTAMEAYKNNDIQGFKKGLADASVYAPKEVAAIQKTLGSVDKTAATGMAHDLLSALVFSKTDMNSTDMMISKAVEKAGPNTPLGQDLQAMLSMPNDEKTVALASSIEFAKQAGLLPGAIETDKLEQGSQRIKMQEKNVEARNREASIYEAKQAWTEKMFKHEEEFGSLPKGFQRDPKDKKRIVSIPGSAVHQDRVEKKRKLLTTYGDSMRTSLRVTGQAEKALKNADWTTTGIVGTLAKYIPETDAADFSALKQTLVSNLGFDRLQAMREASQTGGALGNISERELASLEASIASLEQSQSGEQLRDNLRIVLNQYKTILQKAKLDFKELRSRSVDDIFTEEVPGSAVVGLEGEGLNEVPDPLKGITQNNRIEF